MKRLLVLLVIAFAFPAAAQISFVGTCNGTTSCTPPTHAVGDLFIAYAGVNLTTTASTNPSGWTSVTTQSINGTSTADSVIRLSCKIATTTTETATGFTSATSLVVLIYRGEASATTATCASAMAATFSLSTINTTTTTVTFPTKSNTDASSWNVGLVYAPSATAGIGTAPAGMQNRATAGTVMAGDDTNGANSSYSTANITITTASRVISATLEVKAGTVAVPSGSPNGATTTATFKSVTLSDSTAGATICYTLDGSTPAASAGTCTTGLTYSSSATVTADSTNIRALGSKSGMVNSAVSVSNIFHILGGRIQQMMAVGVGGADSDPALTGATWTLVQLHHRSACASPCTVDNVNGSLATIGSGNLLVVTLDSSGGAAQVTLTSVTSGCTATWTHAANSSIWSGTSRSVDTYYCLDSTSGATSVTASYTCSGSCAISVFEAHSSLGSPVLDTGATPSGTIDDSVACTDCTGVSLVLSGSNNFIVGAAACSGACSGVVGTGWTWDSSRSGGDGVAYGITSGTGTHPTTWTSNSNPVIANAVAFK